MATTPTRSSERLWSEEVGIADPTPPNALDTTYSYEWSNGRRFVAPMATPPEPEAEPA
jgi:hypothetical protein